MEPLLFASKRASKVVLLNASVWRFSGELRVAIWEERQTQNWLEGLFIPSGLGINLALQRRSWKLWLGRGASGGLYLACCHCELITITDHKWKKNG